MTPRTGRVFLETQQIGIHSDAWLTRAEQEATQARIYERVESDADRRVIMSMLFQPPNKTKVSRTHGVEIVSRGEPMP